MHPGIGAVDDVDVSALVALHVVGLDRPLAARLAIDLDAARSGPFSNGRDIKTDFARPIRIADVVRPTPGVEPSDEGELLVEDRRHALVRAMRAEPAAARTESARI